MKELMRILRARTEEANQGFDTQCLIAGDILVTPSAIYSDRTSHRITCLACPPCFPLPKTMIPNRSLLQISQRLQGP